MIHILRANHANMYELQNYRGLKVNIITSLHPLTPLNIKHTKLFSFTDILTFPYHRQLFNRLFGGEQWLFGLKNVIQQGDIVHTAETYTPYTHQVVQLRKSGYINKLICTCWETIPHANEKFARMRKWKQEAYKYVDIFHVPTVRAKNALMIEGVDPRKINVIPYGVDLSIFHPKLPGVSRKVSKPLVLTVARKVEDKGYNLYHQIASKLADIAEYKWIDKVEYSKIPDIYRDADVFFLPSQSSSTWEEQYGMSLVEAMASGLPVVTTHSGAIPEIVGDAGHLLPEHDVDKMVKTLTQIIQNVDQKSQLSKKSILRAQKYYDSKQVSRQLLNLYK